MTAARKRYETIVDASRQCGIQPEQLYINPTWTHRIKAWVEQCARAYERREIADAILLVPARPDTQWFRRLAHFYLPVCFIRGRLQFEGRSGPAPFPSALFYLGPQPAPFVHAFDSLGYVAHCLRHPPDKLSGSCPDCPVGLPDGQPDGHSLPLGRVSACPASAARA